MAGTSGVAAASNHATLLGRGLGPSCSSKALLCQETPEPQHGKLPQSHGMSPQLINGGNQLTRTIGTASNNMIAVAKQCSYTLRLHCLVTEIPLSVLSKAKVHLYLGGK